MDREAAAAREVMRFSVRVPVRSRSTTFTIAVTGDVLPHLPVIAAARRVHGSYDFRTLLRGIRRPIRTAHLALCHLEVPLTRDLTALSGYPAFNAPHHLAAALADVGYDGCSVASNHALDRGTPGVGETLRALDRAGLGHAGTARTRREAQRVRIYRVRGRRVAHLSYTYGLNGAMVPSDRPWTVDLIDRRRILHDARRARRHGAELVVISLHWGAEYVTAPTAAQRRLARRLLASPAVDGLVGHHAHVVQPVGRRHGKVVVYGLGNLLSNQTAACCRPATQDGVIVRLIVGERRDGSLGIRRVEYVPTMVRHPQRRVVAVRRALRRGASGAYAAQLRTSLRRTRRAIGRIAVLSE
ncbi:MAG TPA: CapA family protein [Euzebyales bacterium]|nr:CapA family protein [Euzebyales bacterium]